MQIRLMTRDDYEAVYQLWLSCPGVALNTTDDSPEGIGKFLDRNPTSCFVAEADGKVVGVIMGGHDGRRGYIHHAAVAPDARRQGIASGLTAAVEEALKAEGIVKVNLVAFRRNEEGNAFWEQQDYTLREDLTYWDKVLIPITRVET